MALDPLSSLWAEALPEPPAPRPRPRPVPAVPTPVARPPTPPSSTPPPRLQQRNQTEERETRKTSQRHEASANSALPAGSVWLPPGLFDARGGDGHGGGGHDGCTETGAAEEGGDCDAEALLDLLPSDGQSGIFEILLPNGERMGVMVDVRETSASFLLSPSGERLRNLLRKKRMELEEGLARRMDKYVRLAVL